MFIPEVKFGVSSGKIIVFHNVVTQLDMQIALLLVVKINLSAYILSQLQNNRRVGCVSFLMTMCR